MSWELLDWGEVRAGDVIKWGGGMLDVVLRIDASKAKIDVKLLCLDDPEDRFAAGTTEEYSWHLRNLPTTWRVLR